MRLCYGEGVVALPKAPSFKLEIVIGQRCKYLFFECMQCSPAACALNVVFSQLIFEMAYVYVRRPCLKFLHLVDCKPTLADIH